VTQKAELEKELVARNKEAEQAVATARRMEEKHRLVVIDVASLTGQISTQEDRMKQLLRDKSALVAQNATLTKKLGDIKLRHDQLELEVSKGGGVGMEG